MQIQKVEDSQIDGGLVNKKSQTQRAGSFNRSNGNTFYPNKYMLKLPKTKKVQLSNGQVRYEHTEADYLPVAYVKVICDAGVDTLASCQGRDNPSYHPDIDEEHQGDWPYIKIYGAVADAFIALGAALKEGLPVRSVEQSWFIYPEDKRTNFGPSWRITFWEKDNS